MLILLAIVFSQTVLVEKFGFSNVVYAQVQCCTSPAQVTFVGGNVYCSLHTGTGIPTNCSGNCDVLTNRCINSLPGGGPTITVYDPTCNSGTGYYGYSGVKSALGCLPTDPQTFINTATPWAVGIGAGIAFLLGLYGALMIVISAGDPEKMQAGKEIITSAIAGLLLIVFAVFILRIIGVDVLKLF